MGLILATLTGGGDAAAGGSPRPRLSARSARQEVN
jgi:hypothetical protein